MREFDAVALADSSDAPTSVDSVMPTDEVLRRGAEEQRGVLGETVKVLPALVSPEDTTLAGKPNAATALQPGAIIKHYEIIRKLGAGAMGAVFLARDVRLGRRVAIKFLSNHTTPEAAERFLVEARTTAHCRHDNIVVIYDVDEVVGFPYMVLEYIEGHTLRDAMAENAHPTVAAIVDLMLPVARALACAHEGGIVHRDLKPENILISNSGEIKVADFGIAKQISLATQGVAFEARALPPDHMGLTMDGAVMGTMPYMSPEQWLGESVDASTDIWAMGILLFELATGSHPLEPLSMEELLTVSDLDSPMPSAHDKLGAGSVLAGIIDHCLKKHKEERMPSAKELITALEKAKGSDKLQIGDRIANRYRLERRIGSGGMGDVYLVHDELRGQPVALKLLRRQVAGNLAVVNRFRREARITAQLSSPHAVHVHDFGQADDGSLYLAMEYLDGETMSEVLTRENHLPQQEVIRIAIDLLRVLCEAHGYGIIHRDIKPANVFFAKNGSSETNVVKLLDFGIAKLRDPELTELTASGDVWGTPRYMSPEQARGKAVDQRSDLYSLGVLMYKALTGMFPYEASNVAELAFALLNDVIEAPEKRRPDLGIRPDLGVVVMKALAREVESRYASAAEMVADLQALTQSSTKMFRPGAGFKSVWLVRTCAVLPIAIVFASMLEAPYVLRQPFPGFAVESGALVSAIVETSWPGVQQGIQPYDMVMAVNGAPIHSGQEVRNHLRALPIGTPVEYTMQREGETLTFSVPISVLTPAALLNRYGFALISGLLFSIVGAIVAWRRPWLRETRALFAFTGAMALVLATMVDLDLGYSFSWVWRLAFCLTTPAMVHLGLTYPAPWAPLHRNGWRVALVYLPAIILFGLWESFVHHTAINLFFTRLESFFFAIGAVVLIGRLAFVRFKDPTLYVRQSARVLLWGVVLSLAPSILLTTMFSLGNQWLEGGLWFSVLALTIFPALIAYQLVRGQVFDIDVAFSAIFKECCKVVCFAAAFGIPALVTAAACHAFETGLVTQLFFSILVGIVGLTLASDKLNEFVHKLFGRRGDSGHASVLDQFAAATEHAESKEDVFDSLIETIQRSFSPHTVQLLARGQGDQYWDMRAASRTSSAPTEMSRSMNRVAAGLVDVPKSGDSVESVCNRVTRHGRWDAHAFLVLPFVNAQETITLPMAPSSVLVMGLRADGLPYSSIHVALAAGLIRLAVLRIQTIEGREVAKQQLLRARCVGPEQKIASRVDSEWAFDAPARGLAATLLVRFTGLDKASEHLSPRRFKELMDQLYEAAAFAAMNHGGTMHSLHGDEMLFGFGALSLDRVVTDLDAVHAAIEQVQRIREIARESQTPSVSARCGVSKGVVTVGVFGSTFRQDCLLVGSAIREVTELVNAAEKEDVIVDNDIVQLLQTTKSSYTIDQRPGLVRGAAIRLEARPTKGTAPRAS